MIMTAAGPKYEEQIILHFHLLSWLRFPHWARRLSGIPLSLSAANCVAYSLWYFYKIISVLLGLR